MINLEYTLRIYSNIPNIHFHSPNIVPGKSIACLPILEGTANGHHPLSYIGQNMEEFQLLVLAAVYIRT